VPTTPRSTHAQAAPEARSNATWTSLQRAKNDALWLLASTAMGAVRPMPLPVLRALGRALGVAAHALCTAARRTALANVAMVFPQLDPAQRRAFVRRCFSTLGELLGETVALFHRRSAPTPLPVCREALELLGQARRQGRGVVFASAHLGPWERVAASLVASGVPLVTVARESYDPRFSRWYDKLRTAHGVRVVWRSSPGAAAGVLRVLRAGGVLGLPMDLRTRAPSCEAPFLGHRAPTPVGPARLALRTGALVVVGTAAPSTGADGGARVTATRIVTHDLPRAGDDLASAAVELTARINAELSRRILDLPHAWPWMHERWDPSKRSMMA